jgi:hypothetical protein
MKEDNLDQRKQKTSYIPHDVKSKKKLPFILKNSISSVHEKTKESH